NGTQFLPTGFNAVNRAQHGQYTIYKRECPALRLWCGNLTDPSLGPFSSGVPNRPIQSTDLINQFSVAKYVLGIATIMLLERNNIQWEEKVGDFWPGFAKNGKENIRI